MHETRATSLVNKLPCSQGAKSVAIDCHARLKLRSTPANGTLARPREGPCHSLRSVISWSSRAEALGATSAIDRRNAGTALKIRSVHLEGEPGVVDDGVERRALGRPTQQIRGAA